MSFSSVTSTLKLKTQSADTEPVHGHDYLFSHKTMSISQKHDINSPKDSAYYQIVMMELNSRPNLKFCGQNFKSLYIIGLKKILILFYYKSC